MMATSTQPPVQSGPSEPSPRMPGNPRPRRSWARWMLACALIVAVGGIGAFYWSRAGKGDTRAQSGHREAAAQTHTVAPAVAVQLIRPHRGGMARTTEMPGTIRAFEFAPLYAKVSGYLKELNVDRGDRVKKGQLLALVYDPEVE